MTAQELRKAYLDFFAKNGHAVVPRANLVPQNDPTTLFTGSGMQPLVPYLLGQPHPAGTRVVNSQTCFRAEDIDEVGDNRHTTFFEMLGNWSFGDYFKIQQLEWFFDFLIETLKLDPAKLYITCFIGDEESKLPKDTESAEVWQKLFKTKNIDAKIVQAGSAENGAKLGMQDGRIFYYDAKKNWWSRAGVPANMPDGEIGGPDSEVFYEFDQIKHDPKYGKNCHPNCDCGRFMEIGNSVFMQYLKTAGEFKELPNKNVDFGGGLERLAAAHNNDPDIFKISILWPIIEKLQQISGKDYQQHTAAMRIIADHLRGATFLAADGVIPSNKAQGYVMRRFMRRAMRVAFELGVEQDLCQQIVPVVADIYYKDYPEIANNRQQIIDVLVREEKIFRQTLRAGVREFEKITKAVNTLTGEFMFKLYDTYGFPVELTKEEAFTKGVSVDQNADKEYEKLMTEQRARSQTASKGTFKGGLADSGELTTKYHTLAHLMFKALKIVLGDHVAQKGSNITAERVRFDFSNPEKVTPEQIAEVEKIVNEQIAKDLPVTCIEQDTKEAFANGASGAFGDKYGDKVKVYTIGDLAGDYFSREICGGPHIEHTGQLAEGGKKFKITKEEASSAGIRRIKAVLV